MRYLLTLAVTVLLASLATDSRAEVFVMDTDDDWSILEAAEAGDVVEIAPGTYQFRVYLDNAGTAEEPIVIRAQDPNNRPVWDLVGDGPDTMVDQWPGSYGAGDNHRGCWQVAPDGAYYEISGIVFQNCRAPSSAGIRMINSGPVLIRDCLFQFNTNGLTGASTDLVVEHSELYENGKTITEGNATHHIYVFGGSFALRYSYLHDGHEGQALHIRARESVIEYNWITRPANYVGDIMTCEQFCGPEPHVQTMLVRGNVIVQGEPANPSQLFALFRDADADTDASMALTLTHNTIIGTPRNPGQTHNLINLRNDTVTAEAYLYNNIIVGVGDIREVASPGSDNWLVEGNNNWLSTGTDAGELTDSVMGDAAGFVDAGAADYTLEVDSDAVGAADSGISGAPDREYYRDEAVAMLWRARASANDLGAFEYGNAADPVGPYGTPPDPPEGSDEPPVGDEPAGDEPATGDAPLDAGRADDGTADASADRPGDDLVGQVDVIDADLPPGQPPTDGGPAREPDSGGPGQTSGASDDGCGCTTAASPGPNAALWLLTIGLVRRRRR